MADTFSFFVAGYTVIFGLLGAYIVWLLLRTRQLRKKIAGIKEQGSDGREQ